MRYQLDSPAIYRPSGARNGSRGISLACHPQLPNRLCLVVICSSRVARHWHLRSHSVTCSGQPDFRPCVVLESALKREDVQYHHVCILRCGPSGERLSCYCELLECCVCCCPWLAYSKCDSAHKDVHSPGDRRVLHNPGLRTPSCSMVVVRYQSSCR
jgi:hypothetical protein